MDCVIFGVEADAPAPKVLLVKRSNEPYRGFWALPGGYLEPGESCEQGAARELREETGLTDVEVHQIGAYSDPQRHPLERVITVGFYAVINMREVSAGDDAADARWFPVDAIPQLGFDHNRIVNDAIERIKREKS